MAQWVFAFAGKHNLIVGKNRKDRWTNDVRRTDKILAEGVRQVATEEW